MPDQSGYDELRIVISRGPADGYRIAATANDGSHGEAVFTRPLSDAELDAFVNKIDPSRTRGRYAQPLMDDAQAFGTQLADALFVGDVRDVYRSALDRAHAQHRGLRLSLGLTGVPELMDIPWEFLYERSGFLAQSTHTPVVRSLDLKDVRPPSRLSGPIRILGVVSQPRDEQPLDVQREKQRLKKALGALIANQRVVLEWLEPPTFGALEERLARRDDIHVLHFIGHGEYVHARAGGVLKFEDRSGRPREVTGPELCSVVRDEWSLRLAVLNACEGARTSHVDPFSGVATALVECGIPAVVGMQFSVGDGAAVLFAGRFYTLLADGYPIDAAVARTRAAIYANDFGVEFATPVLFLRGSETRLFDLLDENASKESPPPKPAPAPRSPASPRRPRIPKERAPKAIKGPSKVPNEPAKAASLVEAPAPAAKELDDQVEWLTAGVKPEELTLDAWPTL